MNRSVLVVLVVFVTTNVCAHSLTIFVRDEGDAFRGRVYFTGDDPARNVVVTISAPGGEPVGETTTDDDGNFEYTGPHPAGTVVFVATTEDGHRAESELRNVAAGDTAAPRLVPAGMSGMKSYEAQLTELHEAIDALENRLWLRDVVGGIGYIFGLAGLWALWKARAGGPRH